MKQYTRFLKDEMEKDLNCIYQRNNHKYSLRTPEQNAQALEDKRNHYLKKWRALAADCQTVAQKRRAATMLELIAKYTRA